jgi:hypothetical protein
MAEQFEPTTAESVTTYRVVKLDLSLAARQIIIVLVDNRDKFTKYVYEGDTAQLLMNQLNVADLSTQSLHKRILNRLAADGKLPAGSVTGVPD